jgi:hypothetical protein
VEEAAQREAAGRERRLLEERVLSAIETALAPAADADAPPVAEQIAGLEEALAQAERWG